MHRRLLIALAFATVLALPPALAATATYTGRLMTGTPLDFRCDYTGASHPTCDTARALGYGQFGSVEIDVGQRGGCAFTLTGTSAGLAPADVDLVLWHWNSAESKWERTAFDEFLDESGVAPADTYYAVVLGFAGADIEWTLTFSPGPQWWASAC